MFYKQNIGDVLLNYENEVVLTNEMYGAEALPYIVPDNNVNVRSSSPVLHAMLLPPSYCQHAAGAAGQQTSSTVSSSEGTLAESCIQNHLTASVHWGSHAHAPTNAEQASNAWCSRPV